MAGYINEGRSEFPSMGAAHPYYVWAGPAGKSQYKTFTRKADSVPTYAFTAEDALEQWLDGNEPRPGQMFFVINLDQRTAVLLKIKSKFKYETDRIGFQG
jgi:hypothetical protein